VATDLECIVKHYLTVVAVVFVVVVVACTPRYTIPVTLNKVLPLTYCLMKKVLLLG